MLTSIELELELERTIEINSEHKFDFELGLVSVRGVSIQELVTASGRAISSCTMRRSRSV